MNIQMARIASAISKRLSGQQQWSCCGHSASALFRHQPILLQLYQHALIRKFDTLTRRRRIKYFRVHESLFDNVKLHVQVLVV